MRYFYLSRNELLQGNILVYDTFDIQVPIQAYKTGNGKEDAIEYIGDNIPNDWEYDQENDVIYSKADKPSPYHVFVKGVWIIKDQAGFKKFCQEKIDEIKAEILEYGFDYDINGQKHRQRCRDKDIAYMTSTVVGLQVAKQVLNKDLTKTWYFQDSHGEVMNLIQLGTLMMYGMTFVQSVFDTENYFKKLETPKIITKEEFETKRKEIHKVLAGA